MNHRDFNAHMKGFQCCTISRGYKPKPQSPWPYINAALGLLVVMLVVIKHL